MYPWHPPLFSLETLNCCIVSSCGLCNYIWALGYWLVIFCGTASRQQQSLWEWWPISVCICATPTIIMHMHRWSLSLDVCAGLQLISNAPTHSVEWYIHVHSYSYTCMHAEVVWSKSNFALAIVIIWVFSRCDALLFNLLTPSINMIGQFMAHFTDVHNK